jgi:uncharacterized membrane protein YgcG
MTIHNPIVVMAFLVIFPVVAIIVTMDRVEKRVRRSHERAARTRIEAATLNFDLRAVRERYQRDTGLSDAEVHRVEKEFRRYFLLVALSPGVGLGLPAGRIDDFWHTAITFTATYRAYCREVAGRFIDHDPTGGGDVPYARTYESYRAMFGELPDPQLWPAPDPKHAAAVRRRQTAADGTGCGVISICDSVADSATSHGHGDSCGAGHGCSGSSCSGGGGCSGH